MNNNPQHKGASNSNSPADLRSEGRLIAAVVAFHTPQPVAPEGQAGFLLRDAHLRSCPVLLFPTGDGNFDRLWQRNRRKQKEEKRIPACLSGNGRQKGGAAVSADANGVSCYDLVVGDG